MKCRGATRGKRLRNDGAPRSKFGPSIVREFAYSEYQDRVTRNLTCKRIRCDEIWSFCYAKEKNVPENKRGPIGYGDVWSWRAICAETKLSPSRLASNRDGETTEKFIEDLKSQFASHVQLATDGHKAYLEAVEEGFGTDID